MGQQRTPQEDPYMQGFCTGFPLVGEPAVQVADPCNPDYQRGLADGQRAFEEAGRPSLPYEGRPFIRQS